MIVARDNQDTSRVTLVLSSVESGVKFLTWAIMVLVYRLSCLEGGAALLALTKRNLEPKTSSSEFVGVEVTRLILGFVCL